MWRLLSSAIVATFALLGGAQAQTVQQSGNITPNHNAAWAAPGVIKDGGGAAVNVPLSSASTTSFTAGSTYYCATSGCATGTSIAALSSITGSLSNFYFSTTNSPTGSETYIATLYVGSYDSLIATAVTCTISSSANSCSDVTHTATIASGQAWVVKVVTSGIAQSTGGQSFSTQLTALYPAPISQQTVLQSGVITGGHAVTWVAPGVIRDAGFSIVAPNIPVFPPNSVFGNPTNLSAAPVATQTPTATTPAPGDNSQKLATTAFVTTAVSGINYVTPEQFGAVGNGVADDSPAIRTAITAANTTGKALMLTNKYGFCPDGANPWGLLITSSIVIKGQGAQNGIPLGWLFPLASGCSTPWTSSIDLIKLQGAGNSAMNFLQFDNFTLGNAISPQGRNAIYVDTRCPAVCTTRHNFGFASFINMDVLPTANGASFRQDNDSTEPTGGMYNSLWLGGLYWNGITLHQTGSDHTFLQVLGQGDGIGIDIDLIGGAVGTSFINNNLMNTGGAIHIGQGSQFTITGGGFEIDNGAGSNSAILDIEANVGPVTGVNVIGAHLINCGPPTPGCTSTVMKHVNVGAAAQNVALGTNSWSTSSAAQIAGGNWIVTAGFHTQVDPNQYYEPHPGTFIDSHPILETAGSIITPAQWGRVPLNDTADYPVTQSDYVLSYVAVSTARKILLPPATAFSEGRILYVRDESGSVNSTTKTLSAQPNGTDKIQGSNTTQVILTVPYAEVGLRSDGVQNWYIVNEAVPVTSQTLCYNAQVTVQPCIPTTPSDVFDNYFGNTRGNILERGAAGWAAIAPGTSGKPFVSNGAGADPAYQTLGVSGGGTGATTFTANLPLIGNGTTNVAQGTRSGNTTSYGTTSGALTSGNCAKFDANGNIVDFGGLCGTGGMIVAPAPQGRLTLASGTPVMTANQTGKNTIFYTPAAGNVIGICDGTSFVPTTFAEISNLTTDTTKNPAAVGNNLNYDLFVWNDAGTVRLGRGPAWSSDTARSAGTALVFNTSGACSGFWMNNALITNGPAASRGTYVGTVRSNGSALIDFIISGTGAGGSAATIGVYNAYNQALTVATVNDTNASWTYSTAVTRAADNSNGNRVNWVQGLADNAIEVQWNQLMQVPNVVAAYGYTGFGIDSTTVFRQSFQCFNNAANNMRCTPSELRKITPVIGFHFAQLLELGDGTNTVTFFGNDSTIQGINVGMWY